VIDDARDLTEGETLTADVCIVGSGPAGMTIARRLEGTGLSVLVLESGGLDREEATDELARGTMSGLDPFTLHQHRPRLFGGASSIWSGWCAPMTPEDFEERAWIPESGWPIRYAELVPYYRRAQPTLQLGAFEYDAASISAREAKTLFVTEALRLETGIFQYSAPTRFGTRYRSSLEGAMDVRVLLHANVVDIVLEDGLDRVERIEAQVIDGPRFWVEADRFVLATGGIENARLLLACDGQIEGGIGNGNDLVGRYFMEHPHYYSSNVWVRGEASVDPAFYLVHRADTMDADGSVRSASLRGALTFSRALLASEGLPDFSATMPAAMLDAVDTGELLPFDTQALLPRTGSRVMHRLETRLEQTPFADSRVTLTDDRDALGMRRADLRWQIADEDMRAYHRIFQILGAELGLLGGRVWAPSDGEGRFGGRLFEGGHHMGTTRMAATRERGVVDRDCRMFDVENLYIAGSSVFTTGARVNPTLTVVALAERLADHLAGLPYEEEEE
jgi:choline dehydrogenase-like flavoprotein